MNRYIPLIIVTVVIFLWFNTTFSAGRLGYDAGRNEKVVSELVAYHTFTYFDVPFVVSPPLFFIIHATVASILGLAPWVFRFTESLLFILGSLLIFPIARELGIQKRWSFVVFVALLLDTQTFPELHSIDFWGGILLFSSLTVLTYLRFFKKPTAFSVVAFGLSAGVSMLFKSSFAFLLVPLFIHYIVFSFRKSVVRVFILAVPAIIALLVYLPWVSYLSSNGFPLITNPEFYGKLPWDPGFSGYSYEFVYTNSIAEWPLIFAVALLTSVFLIIERIRAVSFEQGMSIRKKLAYFLYTYYVPGAAFILLLFVMLTLPIFNRALVAIPVGEQFLSMTFAAYLLIGLSLSKMKKSRVQWIIVALLVVNVIWTFVEMKPVADAQEYTQTCPLYTDFFSSLHQDKTVLVDDRLSPVPYPVHNVIYQPFVEWFSFQENFDVIRLVTYNVNYLVLVNGDRLPSYTSSFPRAASYNCTDQRTGKSFDTIVFGVPDTASVAQALGLTVRHGIVVKSGGQPLQANVVVSGGEFSLEFKTKRDGSITLFAPTAGNYSISVSRPGFKSTQLTLTFPGSGDSFINLEKDSPFITHTTASRY